MKLILNIWQFGINIHKDYYNNSHLGWKQVEIYILKLISLPEKGCTIEKKNYKGFRIIFYFWLPIEFL